MLTILRFPSKVRRTSIMRNDHLLHRVSSSMPAHNHVSLLIIIPKSYDSPTVRYPAILAEPLPTVLISVTSYHKMLTRAIEQTGGCWQGHTHLPTSQSVACSWISRFKGVSGVIHHSAFSVFENFEKFRTNISIDIGP